MQRIGFVVIPRFQMMSLAAASVFEFANMYVGEPRYEICVMSESGGVVGSSLGMRLETRPFETIGLDTLIVGAGIGPADATPGLIAYLHSAAKTTRRVAAI